MGSENEMVAVPPVTPSRAQEPAALLAHLRSMPMTEWVWSDAEMILATLARLAPAQQDAQQGEGMPAGMKPWEGGDKAPDDFHYDRVQFSDGTVGSVSKASDLWSRTPVSGQPHVVAYTPCRLATPSSPALDAATIERCAELVDGYATAHQGQALRDLIWGIAGAIRALPNAEKRHG